MSSPIPNSRRQRIRSRTRQLREAIATMDYVIDGTLLFRTKVCGRPNCRCAKDPQARHGPYYEWTRRHGGRLVHSVVTAEQAVLLEKAIANYREVQQLLAKWHDATEADILTTDKTG
jgi:hypothetical protein